MKKLVPAYIISFVLSFMLYICEPITMYLNNPNDFWFDLSIIIKPLLLYTSCLFFGISFGFTILYLIFKKLLKKESVYNVFLLMFFIGFICTYIQGNFLAGSLPILDKNSIDWNKYTTENIVSIVMWIVVIGIIVFTSIKFKMEKVIKVSSYITVVVFVMLSTSLVTTLLTKDISNKENPVVSTMANYDNASTDKNFFIFMLDAVDSVMFEEAMNSDSDFKNTFDDFTYYKDTMSAYAYTRDSVPFIFSGIWDENEEEFQDYSTKAFDNSKLLKRLKDEGYERNMYEYELIWDSKESSTIDNIREIDSTIDYIAYFKNQTKYNLFRYLPFPLKKYSRIEYVDFVNTKKTDNVYHWPNHFNYGHMKDNPINKQTKKVFSFLHVEGAHVPCRYNKNVEYTWIDSYEDTLLGNLTQIDTYLKRLKEAGVYDNSVIIIMADHGFALGNIPDGRQNPILFIKGIDEHHEMIKSEIPVSHADLNDAYMDLLDGKKSTELFSNIDPKRERRFIWYEHGKEVHMVEYMQKGKAWDETTLIKTGKEFNR